MPVTVTIDQVTTEDAQPSVAPHRISNQPGYQQAQVRFTPSHDGQIVPGGALLPNSDGWLFPPAPQRPSLSLRPGASKRPGTKGTLYPDTGIMPDQWVLVPGAVAQPLFPGFTPQVAGVFPGPGTTPTKRPVIGWVLREGGSDPTSGRAVKFAGIRCGALPCSTRRVVSSTDIVDPSDQQVTFTLQYADANDGSGDGTKNENLYVAVQAQVMG